MRHTVFVSAPTGLGVAGDGVRYPRFERHALAGLIILAIALVVIPEAINHVFVKHSPDLPPLEESGGTAEVPLAHLARLGGSAVLLLYTSAVVMLTRGRPDRTVGGVLILLLAVNVPYVISPSLPPTADWPKILLANLFVIALWKTGASIEALKWLPILATGIGVYSLIGGLLAPAYMMYNIVSVKAIVAGWELAGPFGHGNVLGMYCAVAFSLVPLVPGRRWQLFCGAVLLATILASASRTAVIAAVMVLLWWGICRVRSVVNVRFAGTVFVSCTAVGMLILPFLPWDPHAFTDRAAVWAASLAQWQQSPLVGLGVNWFLIDAQHNANVAAWAYVGTGHNLVVDTLVKSGVIGLAVLAPVLVVAILGARTLQLSRQIALFGYLGAFFVAASTEAVWALLPNLQLFPISGMIFAVLVLNRFGKPA
ncbi:O-antigen ligase [Mycolicibacterium sp. 018/SC-01/001]|uniref:O-antigen ligase family protein n=1 Tax=Mycolicibacterium sp. 018/SC-01/001 TaxID=2592069 RepID=UPI0021071CEA|nr:O-antigen ligase family protein [Mycolicibacterium sp. 018/SC-01/001]